MAEGEFALLRQHLEEGLRRTASWVGDHDLYAMLADAAAQERDEAELLQYAPLAEETAERYGHTLYQAIAHRARGVLHRLSGENAASEERLNRALELFRGLDTRWQIGRTLFELGELARVRKNWPSARGHYSAALVAFEEMRAVPDAERTRAALGSLD